MKPKTNVKKISFKKTSGNVEASSAAESPLYDKVILFHHGSDAQHERFWLYKYKDFPESFRKVVIDEEDGSKYDPWTSVVTTPAPNRQQKHEFQFPGDLEPQKYSIFAIGDRDMSFSSMTKIRDNLEKTFSSITADFAKKGETFIEQDVLAVMIKEFKYKVVSGRLYERNRDRDPISKSKRRAPRDVSDTEDASSAKRASLPTKSQVEDDSNDESNFEPPKSPCDPLTTEVNHSKGSKVSSEGKEKESVKSVKPACPAASAERPAASVKSPTASVQRDNVESQTPERDPIPPASRGSAPSGTQRSPLRKYFLPRNTALSTPSKIGRGTRKSPRRAPSEEHRAKTTDSTRRALEYGNQELPEAMDESKSELQDQEVKKSESNCGEPTKTRRMYGDTLPRHKFPGSYYGLQMSKSEKARFQELSDKPDELAKEHYRHTYYLPNTYTRVLRLEAKVEGYHRDECQEITEIKEDVKLIKELLLEKQGKPTTECSKCGCALTAASKKYGDDLGIIARCRKDVFPIRDLTMLEEYFKDETNWRKATEHFMYLLGSANAKTNFTVARLLLTGFLGEDLILNWNYGLAGDKSKTDKLPDSFRAWFSASAMVEVEKKYRWFEPGVWNVELSKAYNKVRATLKKESSESK